MKFFFQYAKPHLKYFIIGPLLMMLEVVGEVVMPYLFSQIINNGIPEGNVGYIVLLGVGMILLMEKIPYWYLRPLLIVPFCVAAHFLRCDYSWRGILIIAVFYMTRDIPLKHLRIASSSSGPAFVTYSARGLL